MLMSGIRIVGLEVAVPTPVEPVRIVSLHMVQGDRSADGAVAPSVDATIALETAPGWVQGADRLSGHP